LYQAAGDSEWHGGMTESISSTGLVIRADEQAVPADSVTIIVSLPPTPDEPGACLVGRGRVARTITSRVPTGLPAFAVVIAEYRFHRRDSLPKKTTH
jgi:hypothetical protein